MGKGEIPIMIQKKMNLNNYFSSSKVDPTKCLNSTLL